MKTIQLRIFTTWTLASAALISAGCATVSTPTADNKPRILNMAEVPKEDIKKFNDPIRSKSESQWGSVNCPKLYAKAKGSWSWKSSVEAASACLKAKDLDKVESLAQDLSQKEPMSPWGPYYWAAASKERNEWERALWFVELALHRAPESGVIHYLRGQILWAQKEYGAAVAAFEKSADYDDSILPAHMLLGQIFYRDQEFTKASIHFYSVLKIEPRNKVALVGYAESQIEDKNPQAAVDAYTRLNDTDPGDGFYLSRLGEIQENLLHNGAEALNVYKLLKQNIKSGKVSKNIDPDLDSKIKELEAVVNKNRSVATSKEK